MRYCIWFINIFWNEDSCTAETFATLLSDYDSVEPSFNTSVKVSVRTHFEGIWAEVCGLEDDKIKQAEAETLAKLNATVQRMSEGYTVKKPYNAPVHRLGLIKVTLLSRDAEEDS